MASSDAGSRDALYAHLRVGTCDIAVPVASVVGAVVVPAEGLTPVPRRRGALEGVLHLDGGVLPVVALDRWVSLGTPDDSVEPRVVILRSGDARVGIRVDALNGVKWIAAGAVRVACHDDGVEELFEAVAPATADHPMLCVLEADRLMALAATWCEEAEVVRAEVPTESVSKRPPSTSYAVFAVGDTFWALTATSISRLEKTPPLEMRWDGRRVCGIGTWDGRKIPLVDMAPSGPGDPSRPWMAVLASGPLAIGVIVSRFERMAALAADEIVPVAGNDLLLGRADVASLGKVSVISIDALLAAVPEATISRTRWDAASAKPAVATSRAATPSGDASQYLIFEADRPYASPATGLLGVVALPAAAIDDLAHGRRSSVDWRGQKLGVICLPSLDGGTRMTEPRIAIVLAGDGKGQARSAIAVRSLTRWLPARVARRSSMRLHGVGEVNVITPPGAQGGGSLVVVDLEQMAYLLD